MTRDNRRMRAGLGEEGLAAVEFAIVAPVLFLIMFGIIETAMIMYTTAVMEGSTTVSSRLGKTGFTDPNQTRQDMIHAMIEEKCGALLDADHLTIETLVYSDYDDIGDPEPFTDLNSNGQHDMNEQYSDSNGNGQWDDDMGTAGLGGAGEIVLYRASYPWHIMTPIMSHFLGDANGNYTITSSVLVKNEPYNVVQVGR